MHFRSLKKQIIIYILGLTFVTIIATTAIGVSSTKIAGNDAANSTSTTLRQQSEELLLQIITSASKQQDALFEEIRNGTETVAFYVKNLYENPTAFSIHDYWDFTTRVLRKNGLYVNATGDVSTFHIPSFVSLDENEIQSIELTAGLDFVVPSMLTHNPNTVAIYTIDTKGVTRYFPNIVLGELGPPDYDPRADTYYLPATPENNPGKKTVWSPLYDDAAGRGPMITATAPVYTKKGFGGIAAIDVLLTNIIATINAYSPIQGSYAFLIDKEGNTVAFPDKAYEDILGRPRAKEYERVNLSTEVLPDNFSSVLDEMKSGKTGFKAVANKAGKSLFTAYAPLKQTEFSMAVVVEESIVLKVVETLRNDISNSIQNTIWRLIIPASIIIILVASVIGVFLSAQVVSPVQQLTKGVREIGKGNLSYTITVKSKNEVGELASSFNVMTRDLKKSRQELFEYSQGLEKQVKKRTMELTVANARLQELDKLKSEFLSFASHQLRSPLTAIKGYASLILEGTYGKIDKKAQEPVDRIFQSSNALASMVEDFLNISKIEQGGMKYDFQMTDFKKLVETVIAEQEPNVKNRKLELKFEAQKGINYDVKIDAGKIKQVIMNLVDNSVKYTPKGSVSLLLRETDHALQLEIRDTGIGFNKETLPKLFAKFSREKNANKINIQGSGLGLYLAKEIIEAHHGKIWAQSQGEGKGASFFVELHTDSTLLS